MRDSMRHNHGSGDSTCRSEGGAMLPTRVETRHFFMIRSKNPAFLNAVILLVQDLRIELPPIRAPRHNVIGPLL